MSVEAYKRDLAYVHDVGFGSFAERSAPGLLKILRHSGISSGLVFDVAEPGRAQGSDRRFWKGRDWACLVEYDHGKPRKLLTRQITTFRKVGLQYRRAEETHVQQLYPGSQLAGDLREIGFRVRMVRGYGDLRFSKAHVGLIARKP